LKNLHKHARYLTIILGLLAITGCGDDQPSSDSSIHITQKKLAVSSFDPDKTIEFNSYALISTDKLGNGQEARVQFWPGVLDTEDCTAALVGPNTILTAAHCIDDPRVDVPPEYTGANLKWGTERFPLICKMNPDYVAHGKPSNPLDRRGPEDHALCHIGLPGGINSVGQGVDAVETDYVYETIELSGNSLSVGASLLMVGFGCVGGQPVAHQMDNGWYEYRIPDAIDIEDPRVLRFGQGRIEGESDFTDGIFSSISTNGDRSMAVVCPGDSGGPVFSSNGTESGPRRIVGVNSMAGLSNVRRGNEAWPISYYQFSEFASTSSASFKKFLEAWIKETETEELCLNGYTGTTGVKAPSRGCHH